jgi:ABC-type uncharacterized transport system permease subunit
MTLPRLRLEPRLDDASPTERLVRICAGLAIAVLISVAVLGASGHDPLIAFAALYRGAFGSLRALQGTLNKAVPIGLCALGIALAYRARLWNIGAEGQLYFGAFAATGVGLHLPAATPGWAAVPLVVGAGMLAGGFWAGLAALPRAWLGMNEILSTLMLTYIAILWVDYLVIGPWVDPRTYSFPFSEPIVEGAQIGAMLGSVHWGVAILLLAAGGLLAVDHGLRWGYELRLVGDAPRAAAYGGIDNARAIVAGLVAAGMLAGLAGAIEVSASTTRLQSGLSPGYGFMAILVAWLGNTRPMAILLAAVLYAGLANGGFALQVSGVPPAIGTILQAGLLIGILAAVGLADYRIRLIAPPRPSA